MSKLVQRLLPRLQQLNEGTLIVDATTCPQDISYPTDLNLLSDAREKSEELVDVLFQCSGHSKKPRTYRELARKKYLSTAQKRHLTRKEIRRAIKEQLLYLKRNLNHIHRLLDIMGGPFALTDFFIFQMFGLL